MHHKEVVEMIYSKISDIFLPGFREIRLEKRLFT